MNKLKNKNILICITGSIAAYKACEIIRNLRKEGAQTQVAISESGQKFIGVATLAALSNNKVLNDLFPQNPRGGLDHINLAFEIDLIIVVPTTANTLCKVGNGIADDLISTILSICEQKQIFIPAMNYKMWQNKATIDAVRKLRERNKIVLEPDEGKLASLHIGEGRLPSIEKIMNEIRKSFKQNLHLENMNVLITAGPTRETIDPVRFISNRSSGKMGFAIAKIAKDYGANIDLISGPVSLEDINQINIVKVETAIDMNDKINALLESKQYDYIFMVAAVSDYRVDKISKEKIKSSNQSLNIKLIKNPDILENITNKSSAKIIGFALETNNGEKNAINKMNKKKLDYIILNYANEKNAGFDSNTNHVYLYSKNGFQKELKTDRKDRIAKLIIDNILENE